MRKVTIYHRPDGSWSLDAKSHGEPMVVELSEGWLLAKGHAGPVRVLSARPDQLGMTMEQAIQRGIVNLSHGSSQFERATLTRLKAAPRRSSK